MLSKKWRRWVISFKGTSFQQDGSTPYAGKKVAGCEIHWTNRGMHHASRALLHIFSYLECCFWWVAMQDVAKSSSTIEGHMTVVNRFDVHINGQWHPSSTPHEKSSGLEAAASGTHFEHVLYAWKSIHGQSLMSNVNVPMWWSKCHICLCAQRVYWYRNCCLLFAL